VTTASDDLRFSIVTPVYNPPIDVLREMVASVVDQTFRNWELILVDDASPDPAVRVTLHELAAADPRIVVLERAQNGGIVAASNDGLSRARGEFVALLDHDDTLDLQALEVVDIFAEQHPDMDYCYSDEDHIAPDGSSINVFQKPAWSPERFTSQNYCCHFSVFRNTLLHKVGGFRDGFDGSQDYDLILRAVEQARQVVHVPMVLYHWRQIETSVASNAEAKPYAYEAGRRAVVEHLRRTGIDADVDEGERRGTYRVVRHIVGTPLTSVILATDGLRGRAWGVQRCFAVEAIASVVAHTTRDIELVVVVTTATPAERIAAMARAAGDARIRFVEFDGPFNRAQMLNLGAVSAEGDFLFFLGDDCEIIGDDFLDPLIGLAQDETIGAVGGKAYAPDGRIHHAGYILDGAPNHFLRGVGGHDHGSGSALDVQRECVGVSAECMLIDAKLFEKVGGFNPALHHSYFGIDLCMKLTRARFRIVWTPSVELLAFDARTESDDEIARELDLLRARWGAGLVQDPYIGGTTKLR
jgi:GT2 family glycosyltransferase